jgi:TATA element modulatory factor
MADRILAISRSPSNARVNDRLQERLARAMVKPQRAGSFSSHLPSAGVLSQASTPRLSNDARSSLDSTVEIIDDSAATSVKQADTASNFTSISNDFDVSAKDSRATQLGTESSQIEGGHNSDERNQLPEMADNTESKISDIARLLSVDSPSEATSWSIDETIPAPLQVDHEDSDARLRGEIHDYIERIDALQSKLKYLAKEAAETARRAASSAEPGSIEKQLLEKDERIALLLEEGQKLSKAELGNRATIKKLRQQITENNTAQAEGKKRVDKLEKDLAGAEARANRAEAGERRANDAASAQAKASRELETVTSERNALNLKVQDLKSHLDGLVARSNAVEEKARSEALEEARRHIAELEDHLSSARIERELSEEKLRREIASLRESLEREKEGARALEAELKGEQSILESKMESLRVRAEEASSSAAGDAQAKVLRQIETLQTQYTVASENWRGIEGSLLSRLGNVEKERDDIARRETDLRRKAREVVRRSLQIFSL